MEIAIVLASLALCINVFLVYVVMFTDRLRGPAGPRGMPGPAGMMGRDGKDGLNGNTRCNCKNCVI